MTRKQLFVSAVLLGLVGVVANNWLGLLRERSNTLTVTGPTSPSSITIAAGKTADAGAGGSSAFVDQPNQVRIVGHRGEDARQIAQRVYRNSSRAAEIALANQLIDTEVLANDRTVLVDINALAAGGFAGLPDPFRRTNNEGPAAPKAAPAAHQQPVRRLIPVGPDLFVSVPENSKLPPTAYIAGKSYSVGDRYGGGTIADITSGGVTVVTMSGAPRSDGPRASHKSKQSPGAPGLLLEVEH